MVAVDSSVAIAAFATWHQQHQQAKETLASKPHIIGHCAFETYSVLTRLPAPHRVPPATAADFLGKQFKNKYLTLPASDQVELVSALTGMGISGGAVYDALVATTAANAGAKLISCDVRASTTYKSCGVDFEMIAG